MIRLVTRTVRLGVWIVALLGMVVAAAACGAARPAGSTSGDPRSGSARSSSASATPPPGRPSPTASPRRRPSPTASPRRHPGPTASQLPHSTSAPPTTPAAPRAQPPFPVTEVTVPIVDHSRATVDAGLQLSPYRALTTDVWVPDVPGRWPLVVFAAGFRVGPAPYAVLLEGWAAHGYVVAAPEFPLTDAAVAGAHLDEGDIVNEPADVRFVTDTLVDGSNLSGRIDPNRVAVAGHSDGAEVALAVAGLFVRAGEPAYRALVVMSPQPISLTRPVANPPILVVQGTADTINPFARGRMTWLRAAAPKYFEILHGGGHLGPLEAASPWLGAIAATTESFLDAYLAGDGTPAAITGPGNQGPLSSVVAG